MKSLFLRLYQVGVALSDTCTGIFLILAPQFTMGLLGVSVDPGAEIYISYIGAFVLGVGLCCGYGALLLLRKGDRKRMEMVWLLTAIVRGSVAAFVATHVLAHQLDAGWLGVAAFDGLCALMQGVGLKQEWLNDVTC
jgi:hypothetical protein